MSGLKSKGLSMVELLVALAISAFLILGITQIYLDNKRNYSFHQAQLNNLSGARYIQYYLDDLLGKAGYRRAPDQDMEVAFPYSSASGGCADFLKGSVITKISSGKGLCLRYQPAHVGEFSCDGNGFELGNSNAFIPSGSDEMAVAKINFDPISGAISCNGQEIVAGIADIRIEFGLGEDLEKRIIESTPFVDAGSYSGEKPILAVRYSILMADGERLRDGSSVVLDTWVSDLSSEDGKRLLDSDASKIYQVVSATRALRNATP